MGTRRTTAAALLVGILAACACSKSSARSTGTPTQHGTATASPATPKATPKALKLSKKHRSIADIRVKLKGPGTVASKLTPYLHATTGRDHFDNSRWQACSTAIRIWLQNNAKHPHARSAAILATLCDEHAGHFATAATNYEELAANDVILRDVLTLRAAESWLGAGASDKAIAALSRLPQKGFARAARANEIRGRAWRQKGDHARAYPYFAAAAKRSKAGAAMLFDAAESAAGLSKPADEAKWLRAVLARHPGTSREADAAKRLAKMSPELARLTDEETLQRAENARRTHKRKLAVAVASKLMKRGKSGRKTWCEAGLIKARALETWRPRRKEAAALYDKLARTCARSEWSAKLRYRAAKRQMNSASGKRAIQLFDEVAEVAPKSSLVDDAMRYQALILRQSGKAKAANAKLEKILVLGGDMVEYAGWDLLWQQVSARRWKQCVATGKRVMQATKSAAKRYNEGRAAYWTAVCELKAKKRKAAIHRFASVAKAAPRSWYGMLAEGRLKRHRGKKSATVKGTSDAASNRTRANIFEANERLLMDAHFVAGIELLRLGMKTSAAGELAAVNWDPRAPSEVSLRAMLYSGVGEHSKATAIASTNRHFDGQGRDVTDDRKAWEIAYPRPAEFAPIVADQAKAYGVDPMFVWAIMRSESRFNRRATSPVLATGLLQLMPGTARTVAKRLGETPPRNRTALMQPALNIHLGTAYMKRLLDRTGGHYALVASSYNAGPHNTKKWLTKRPKAELDEFVEQIPFRENRRYVKSVVTSWLRYSALYSADSQPQPSWRLTAAGAGRSQKASAKR